MFDSMISQTRQVVTVGRSRGVLEGFRRPGRWLLLGVRVACWRVWLLALGGLWPR